MDKDFCRDNLLFMVEEKTMRFFGQGEMRRNFKINDQN